MSCPLIALNVLRNFFLIISFHQQLQKAVLLMKIDKKNLYPVASSTMSMT